MARHPQTPRLLRGLPRPRRVLLPRRLRPAVRPFTMQGSTTSLATASIESGRLDTFLLQRLLVFGVVLYSGCTSPDPDHCKHSGVPCDPGLICSQCEASNRGCVESAPTECQVVTLAESSTSLQPDSGQGSTVGPPPDSSEPTENGSTVASAGEAAGVDGPQTGGRGHDSSSLGDSSSGRSSDTSSESCLAAVYGASRFGESCFQ